MCRLIARGGLGLAAALFLFGCQKEGVATISDASVVQGGAIVTGGATGVSATGGGLAMGGVFATGGGLATGGVLATGGDTARGGSQGGVGGAPGTGGLSSSGGVIGAGGVSRTGGAIVAGGIVATGGTVGRGGSIGSKGGAGASGSGGGLGGYGSGGMPGAGGAGGIHGGSDGGFGDGGGQQVDSGVTCADLETRYADALPAARSCDVNAIGQCQQLVSSSLSPCFVNCTTYVNTALTLNAIKASWLQAGCNQTVVMCPLIACIKPSAGVCASTDGGSGTCNTVSGILLPPTN